MWHIPDIGNVMCQPYLAHKVHVVVEVFAGVGLTEDQAKAAMLAGATARSWAAAWSVPMRET